MEQLAEVESLVMMMKAINRWIDVKLVNRAK